MDNHLLKEQIDDKLAKIQVIGTDLDKLVLVDHVVNLYCKSGQIYTFIFDNTQNAYEGMKLLEQQLFSQWEEESNYEVSKMFGCTSTPHVNLYVIFAKWMKQCKEVKIKVREGCILIERIK